MSVTDYDISTRCPEDLTVGQLNEVVRALRKYNRLAAKALEQPVTGKIVPHMEANLGDVIQLGFNPFGSATVIQKNESEGWIRVFRPYVHVDSAVYSNGLIPLVGHEDFKIHYGTVNVVKRA